MTTVPVPEEGSGNFVFSCAWRKNGSAIRPGGSLRELYTAPAFARTLSPFQARGIAGKYCSSKIMRW